MTFFHTFHTTKKSVVCENNGLQMASKRKYRKTEKDLQLQVLQEIFAAKDILFGKFCGTTLQKTDIQNEWRRISLLAASFNLIADNEGDGEKFRRITWQNWRRSSMAKINRMKKTGEGGAGNEDLIDENDKIILAIIGNEIAFGVGSQESQSKSREDNAVAGPSLTQALLDQPHAEPQPSSSRVRAKKPKESTSDEEIMELKKKLLKISYYLKQLECREKELLLNLDPSEFTNDIFGIYEYLSDDD